MLGTETDFLILQLLVDDIKQFFTINLCIRKDLDFGSVPAIYLSGLGDPDHPNARVVGRF